MKRFFMCCIVVVVSLFLGFTAYYFVANKEYISLASENASTIKLNVGDTLHMDDVLKHDLPNAGTVIDVDFSLEGVLSYDYQTKLFTAEKVGNIVVTLTPSNAKFGPFVLAATVGDGRSQEYPYFIRTADELASIGANGSKLTTSMSYELASDIYLTGRTWTPMAAFSGTFDGSNHVIYDMAITNSGDYAGFISKVEQNALVQKITFVKTQISGNYKYCGVVAGENKGTIALCHVLEAKIANGGNGATGAICGWNNMSQTSGGGLSARIGMCGVETSTITASGDVGGIVGVNTASIVENCYAVLDSVNGNSSALFGGIVSKNEGYNGTYEKVSTIYKSYAYALSVSNVARTSGIAAENKNASTNSQNTYVYNIFAIETPNFVGTSTSFDADKIAKKAPTDLKVQATYPTWDFNRVWKMSSNYAVINFASTYSTNISDSIIFDDNLYPSQPEVPGSSGNNNSGGSNSGGSNSGGSSIIIPGVVSSNITASNIWEVLKEMSQKPNSGKRYTFSTSFTVDVSQAPADCTDIFPLGTKEKPFNCHINSSSTTQKITFKNLNVSGKPYSSLFGFVGAGATISGIKIQNATIVGNGSTAAGVLAAEVRSGATIQNCVVTDSTLSGIGNLGFIAGYNAGTVISNTVSGSTLTAEGTSNAGIVVGVNVAGLNKNTVQSTGIVANGKGYFGGVAGTSSGIVDNSTIKNVTINAEQSNTYIGGVIGKNTGSAAGNGVIDSTLSALTTEKSVCVGGLAASSSGTLSKSSVLNTVLTGYYVGGLAALNSGKISICASGKDHTGKIQGIYTGGLVCFNQKDAKIDNCVVGTQLVTDSDSKKACGFAYKLEEGSIITHSFSYAKFYGDNFLGLKHICDTETPFRNWYTSNILQNTPFGEKMGTIENSLFCNVSSAKFYHAGITLAPFADEIKEIQITEDQAKGSDNWIKFHENGFALSSIWKRTQGQWLSLQ